jgi:hypothetical protein
MKKLLLGITLLFSMTAFSMSYIEGCAKYTYSNNTEKLCMELQVPVRISKACYAYTNTPSNEKYCLINHENLTQQKIYDCGRFTRTNASEADCLYPGRGWFE